MSVLFVSTDSITWNVLYAHVVSNNMHSCSSHVLYRGGKLSIARIVVNHPVFKNFPVCRALKDQPPVRADSNKPTRSLKRVMEGKKLYEKIKSGEFVSKAAARETKRKEAMQVLSGADSSNSSQRLNCSCTLALG